MDWVLLQNIIYVAGPVFTILILPIIRGLYVRLDTLEKQIQNKVSSSDVRQLLSDKLDPVHEDLSEIKQQLNQIINRLIDKKS